MPNGACFHLGRRMKASTTDLASKLCVCCGKHRDEKEHFKQRPKSQLYKKSSNETPSFTYSNSNLTFQNGIHREAHKIPSIFHYDNPQSEKFLSQNELQLFHSHRRATHQTTLGSTCKGDVDRHRNLFVGNGFFFDSSKSLEASLWKKKQDILAGNCVSFRERYFPRCVWTAFLKMTFLYTLIN